MSLNKFNKNNKINVYDAFLYKNKKFIMVFSYLPNTVHHVQPFIDEMAKSFNLKIINMDQLLDKPISYTKLESHVQQILSESNTKLQSMSPSLNFGYYGQGILIHGSSFVNHKITFYVDLHLYFSLSLTIFLSLNPTKTIDDFNLLKKSFENIKINKYFNLKPDLNDDSDKILDEVFFKIVDFIEFKVYGKDYDIYSSLNKKTKPMPKSKSKSVLQKSYDNEYMQSVIDDIEINHQLDKKKSKKNKIIFDSDTEADNEADNNSDTEADNEADNNSDTEADNNSDNDSDNNSDNDSDTESDTNKINTSDNILETLDTILDTYSDFDLLDL